MAEAKRGDAQGDARTRIAEVIFDLAPIGIEIYDSHGRLLDANAKCIELFGVTDVAQVKGFALFDDPNLSADHRATLRLGRPVAYERGFDFDLVRSRNLYPTARTGKTQISVVIEPIKDASGSVASYLVLVQDITERKRVEDELRREKHLFSLLMENSPVYIFFKDRSLRALRLSRNFEQMLGRPVDQALGKTMEELFPPELATSMVADDRKVIEEGQLVKVEETLGGRRYETIKFPVGTEDGETILAGFVSDITERKLADLALRDSEARFRKAFEDGSIGMVLVNEKFFFFRANAAFCAMLGYTEDELRKLTFKDITHSAHLAGDIEGVIKVMRGELPNYKTQKRYVRKDGRIVWGAAAISAIRNPKGEFLYFLTMIEDVSERMRAQQELAETTERLALAVRAGRLGIWDWNVEDNAMLWDDRMLELYGLTRERFTGNVDAWTAGLHPEDREAAVRLCQRALDGEAEFDTEFRVQRPDGGTAHIKANGMVIRDSQGRPLRMIGINADITEHRRTEEALQNAQRLESLGLLAGGIAHDFNNLLTGIYGFTQLAREETMDANVADCLNQTLATIDRARALTRQLLTFAKGGAPVKKVAPLFPFVQETAHFALSGSNVTCRFEVAPDLQQCDYDQNQIGQVIDNLVLNAQQAMPLGGTIVVSARNVSVGEGELPGAGAGSYVKISVRDNGVGIQSDLVARIFDPFFTTKPKGHGLGLSTCYSIVRRHGGSIQVESELGKGSTFHVYLPASSGAATSAKAIVRSHHQGSGTFLVMDDEEVVRSVLARMLESFGYQVLCRPDGQSAIDLFRDERQAGRGFAGMIFDLTIPAGMGGQETVQVIRQVDAQVPVFVASGYAEDPVVAAPRDYGFTASIRKPFRKTELEDLLRRHVASGAPQGDGQAIP